MTKKKKGFNHGDTATDLDVVSDTIAPTLYRVRKKVGCIWFLPRCRLLLKKKNQNSNFGHNFAISLRTGSSKYLRISRVCCPTDCRNLTLTYGEIELGDYLLSNINTEKRLSPPHSRCLRMTSVCAFLEMSPSIVSI